MTGDGPTGGTATGRAATRGLLAYDVARVRAAEAPALRAAPEGWLMQRASAGVTVACTRALRERYGRVAGRSAVLLVGSGDNGGDALFAGARLRERGVAVVAAVTGRRVHGPGRSALLAAGGRVVDATGPAGRVEALRAVAGADLVVDGIVGLGGSPGLRQPAGELVDAVPAGVPVVAVDLPSGIDPDTGHTPSEHVRADVTVAMGALTPGLLVPPASHAAGRVERVDVGFGPRLPGAPTVERLAPRDAADRWPVPARDDHKYRRGVLGVVAGSDRYPGAAVLACAAAVRSGAGFVRYVGPAEATRRVVAARPEVAPGATRVQAWLLGSGVEDDTGQEHAIGRALDSGLPCVVDAGALAACAVGRAGGRRPAAADRVLLTPHAGELARVLTLLGHDVGRDRVEAQPWRHAHLLAREVGVTVLLKGSVTLVVRPDGTALSQADGPAWLATAGSGDVLAGIAGTLLAAGLDAATAGALAAQVHGLAGARASAGGPVTASEVADAVPATLAAILAPGA